MSAVSISSLLSRPFKLRPFSEKKELAEAEPPRPRLDLRQQCKETWRRFSISNYEKHTWLAGCPDKNALFCYPCVLFSSAFSVWTRDGYKDLANFYKAAAKHENSANHIRSVIAQKSFGRVRIQIEVSNIYQVQVSHENETVRRNREILKRLIDVTCHLAKLELPCRSQKSFSSADRGNYIETVALISNYDVLLQQHLQEATAFSGLSDQTQNDLIDCITRVLRNEVLEEIKRSLMVSIQLDETTNLTSIPQLTVILRYVRNSSCVERLVSFFDIGGNQTAQDLAKLVISTLRDFDCFNKVVAQTTDGASVMASSTGGVQAIIKEHCPCAVFVHCYAHKLNLTLAKSLSSHYESKAFFQFMSSVATFFKNSSKRTELLLEKCYHKIPTNMAVTWSSKSTIVHVLHENLCLVREVFADIVENRHSWDAETIYKVKGFLEELNDFTFVFLLKLFHELFVCTDYMFQVFQSEKTDLIMCGSLINSSIESIQNIKNKVPELYQDTRSTVGPPQSIRNVDMSQTKFQTLAEEIVGKTVEELQQRFVCNRDIFVFLTLLDPENFDVFKNKFPEESFSSLFSIFESLFDKVKLRNELSIVYSTEQFRNMFPSQIAAFLSDAGLVDTMPEVYRLCILCMTIPISANSAQGSFSCLKRIKNHLRSPTLNEKLTNFRLLSIEKEFLCEVKSKQHFYDTVINLFAEKERGLNLKYAS